MKRQADRVFNGPLAYGVLCGLIVVGLATTTGCSSERPKPMSQPTPEQVKSNSDRTFEKLKQEERERKPAGQ